MTSTRAALALALAVSAAVAALPANAAADTLTCGQVITQDVTLTADLTCTEEDPRAPIPEDAWPPAALVIDAEDVTLDLNGHSLSAYDADALAVFGHSHVTIKNGGVSGLRLVDSSDSRVSGIETSGSFGSGIGLIRSKRNQLDHNQVFGEAGVRLSQESTDNLVADNTISAPAGALVLYGDHNRIERNLLCGGMGGPLYADHAHYNLIKRNLVPASLSSLHTCGGYGGEGIVLGADTSHNQLLENRASNIGPYFGDGSGTPVGGDGIDVLGAENLIAANTANDNYRYGINAAPGNQSGVNYARGNGGPAQCLNVICRPGPARLAPAGPRPAPHGPPGHPTRPGRPHHKPPKLHLRAHPRLGRCLRLSLRPSQDLWLSVQAELRSSGHTYTLKAIHGRYLAQGQPLTVKLRLGTGLQAKLARALRQGRHVSAKLSLSVRDQAGHTSRRRQRLTLKL
jgi:Periplasmic copper-binding protein (NosD)